MKRGPELAGFLGHGAEAAAKRRAALNAAAASPGPPGSSQRMGMKLLFPPAEAKVIHGQDGATVKSLESLTGTRVRLSPEGFFYPGTGLRQLTILGGSCESVLNAVLLALSHISEAHGFVAGDEAEVEPEGARLKVLVPQEVAEGLDEEGIDRLHLARGVRLHLLPASVPSAGEAEEVAEQIVCLSGNLTTVRSALQSLGQLVSALACRSWFGRWAGHSHCKQGPPPDERRRPRESWGGSGAIIPGELSVPWGEGLTSNGSPRPGGAIVPGELSAPLGEDAAPESDLPPGTLVLKLLLLEDEIAVLRGENGAIASEIQQKTGAEFRFNPQGETYPGTSLEELHLFAPSPGVVAQGAIEALGRVLTVLGSLGGPEEEPGSIGAKLVIPAKATSAVIGPGGQVVMRMRAETQMHVHVESTTVPLNGSVELSEQVVSFDGPFSGLETALAMMADILTQFVAEPWFGRWAAGSNVGNVIPGLTLFMDDVKGGKGKAKGKGKGKGKDGGHGWGGGLGLLTMKLLVPPNEASCVLGKGGATVREIGQVTGTRVTLSGRDQFYPGTQLQELVIKGSSQESIVNAAMQTLERISSLSGSVNGGEARVEPGGCRLKVVVPSASASAIIGPGGSVVRTMRDRSRMHVHVEETIVPPGPPHELTDQVVSLSGPLDGTRTALSMLAEVVGQFASAPWFDAWSGNSHCGLVVPGLVLFADGGKGKGKGKGKDKFMGPGMFEEHLAIYSDGGKDKGKGKFKGKAPKGFGGDFGHAPSFGRKGEKGGFGGAAGGAVAVKMLVSPEEVGILSEDASTMAQIKRATGSSGMLSETSFPGTALQELAIQGPSPDSLLEALLMILRKVADTVGAVGSGELGVPQGDARVKLVVPTKVAAAVIGPGGQNVKQLKVHHGVHVHVDPTSIPCPHGIGEQGVCVAGPLASIEVALGQVVSELANCIWEPWFEAWASHSNAGEVMPGLVLFEGKGKGKGGKGPAPGGWEGKGGKGPPMKGGWDGKGPPAKGGWDGYGGKGPMMKGGWCGY